MTINAKAPQPILTPVEASNSISPTHYVKPLDPRLQHVRDVTFKGQYQRALQLLPADSQDPEIRNCRAVCLIRLCQFESASSILRTTVLNSATCETRPEIADHIKINFAIALFYGGHPSGALDVLLSLHREDDPGVKQLRQAIAQWVAGMSWLQRLDWKLNGIAPQKIPSAPEETLGRFIWEVV